MVELADVIARHGQQYRTKFSGRIPSRHLKAMKDIEQCRTAARGGQVYQCTECKEFEYRYHSCKNRHCPKCQNGDAGKWLDTQESLLLPVPYFLVTFTLPQQLRQLVRSHQKLLYGILFRASAQALQRLAADPRRLGGTIGLIGVLHTWSRDLGFHPHVHFIVPAGALSPDGTGWRTPRYRNWLFPVRALSKLFRGTFRAMLAKTGLLPHVARRVWSKRWNVHCQPAGTGREVLKYLAPYVHRVALTNRRIKALHDGKVTYVVRNRDGHVEQRTVEAEEFLRRFLQHVLPHGFQKVRYYGFFCSAKRDLLDQVRHVLGCNAQQQAEPPDSTELSEPYTRTTGSAPCARDRCRKCGGPLRWCRRLDPAARAPPSADAA